MTVDVHEKVVEVVEVCQQSQMSLSRRDERQTEVRLINFTSHKAPNRIINAVAGKESLIYITLRKKKRPNSGFIQQWRPVNSQRLWARVD